MNPVQKAVSIIGNQSILARLCNVKPQAVQKWCSTGKLPASRVLAVEKAAMKKVTRYELRPDLYPLDDH